MYIVIELQKNGTTLAPLTFSFDDYYKALEKYYKVLAAAAVSSVEVHSASVLDEFGNIIKNDSFTHKQ